MNDESAHALEAHDWAGEMGEKWNAYLDRFESMIGPVGADTVRFAELVPGESVLDIGSGGGATTFDIAELVGPTGHVTGLDLSATLVATARRRAVALDFENIDFVQGDAATIALERRYDCLFSRFGLMFFDDPYAALAHIHGFARPGGRLRFCCWGPTEANPWVSELMEVPRRFVEIPEPENPKAPGPFAFSDPDYVGALLEQAGFGDIELTEWNGEQLVGGAGASAEEAARFLVDALFVGDALKDEPEATREKAFEELRALLEPYTSERGVVMGANAWLVGARA